MRERGLIYDPALEAGAQLIRHAEFLLSPAIGASTSRQVLSLLLKPRTVSGQSALKLIDAGQSRTERDQLARAILTKIAADIRGTFRYIHDSWNQTYPTPLWTNGTSFPTIQTAFGGPGLSMVARLTATASPTLLNEFVASYTTDHITLTPLGAFQRPASMTFGLFPGVEQGKGNIGKLLKDEELYNRLNGIATEGQTLLADVRNAASK
jgi:hypothetical protein